jgi:iron complex transport system ATP-binding protein
MLQASGLDIVVPGRVLIRGLELAVGAGECWAVLGPNGGGKTLLLHTLAGLRPPDGGAVHLDGAPLADWGRRAVAQRLALLLQEEASDYWGSVWEYVALGRHPFGRHGGSDVLVAEAIDQLGLSARSGQSLRSLSGGERQRARVAQTVAQDTALLLWDEPLNHLDLRQQGDVMRIARALCARGKCVVLTVHEPAWAAAYCSHALLLYDSGRSASGPARSIINDRAIRELYSLEQPTPALPAS